MATPGAEANGAPTTAPRDARISLLLAIGCALLGAALVVLGTISSMPGACGLPDGCPGGRDATPLTGIGVGGVLLGIAWAAWRKAKALRAA